MTQWIEINIIIRTSFGAFFLYDFAGRGCE
nr:MAG TPA: hypothetical protein [Caudoviricetes sp.]